MIPRINENELQLIMIIITSHWLNPISYGTYCTFTSQGCTVSLSLYTASLNRSLLPPELLLCNLKPYLSCVSPALTLILPTVSTGFLCGPPQGMMVCTRFHTFFHSADPSQRSFSNMRSPKSLSRVIRKVRLILLAMVSVLFEKGRHEQQTSYILTGRNILRQPGTSLPYKTKTLSCDGLQLKADSIFPPRLFDT